MPETVAVNVILDMSALNTKVALPDDERGPPVEVVGVTGTGGLPTGGSWSFVIFAVSVVWAASDVAIDTTVKATTVVISVRMDAPSMVRRELSMQHHPRSGHDTTGHQQVNGLVGQRV